MIREANFCKYTHWKNTTCLMHLSRHSERKFAKIIKFVFLATTERTVTVDCTSIGVVYCRRFSFMAAKTHWWTVVCGFNLFVGYYHRTVDGHCGMKNLTTSNWFSFQQHHALLIDMTLLQGLNIHCFSLLLYHVSHTPCCSLAS